METAVSKLRWFDVRGRNRLDTDTFHHHDHHSGATHCGGVWEQYFEIGRELLVDD